MEEKQFTEMEKLKTLRRKLIASGLCLVTTVVLLLLLTTAQYVTPTMRSNLEFSPAYFNTVLLGDLDADQVANATEVAEATVYNSENATVTQTITGEKLTESLKLELAKNAFGAESSSGVYTVDSDGKWVDGSGNPYKKDSMDGGAAPGDKYRLRFSITNGTTVKKNGIVDPANDENNGRNIVANQAGTDIRYTLSVITTKNLPLTYTLLDLDDLDGEGNPKEYQLDSEDMLYDTLGGMCSVHTVQNTEEKVFVDSARILPWAGEDTLTFHRYELVAEWEQEGNRDTGYAYDSRGNRIPQWVEYEFGVGGVTADTVTIAGKVYRYARDYKGRYTLKSGESEEIKLDNTALKAGDYTGYKILTYQTEKVDNKSAVYMKEIENIEIRVEVESFVNNHYDPRTSEEYVSAGHIILGEDGKGVLDMEQFVKSDAVAEKVNIKAARLVSFASFGDVLTPDAEDAAETEIAGYRTGSDKLYRYQFDVANGVLLDTVWVPDVGATGEAHEGPVIKDKTGHYQRTYRLNGDEGEYSALNIAMAVPMGKSGVGSDCLTGRKYYIVTEDGTVYTAEVPTTPETANPVVKVLQYFKRVLKWNETTNTSFYDYTGTTDSNGWAVLKFKAADENGSPLTTKSFTKEAYSTQSFRIYMIDSAGTYEPHNRNSNQKAMDSRDEFRLYFYQEGTS